MMIARRLLLNRLEAVAPAVATDDMIPVSTHICFTGTHVIAWNDKIAISTPRSSAFTGCIPGKILTELLSGSRAAVVGLQADGDKVAISLGSSMIRLPMCPVAEFAGFFSMPRMPKRNLLANGIAGRFLAGTAHCLPWCDIRSVVADKLGVTALPSRDEVQLFSTNGSTISRATLPLPPGHGFQQRVILSTDSCKEMLRLATQAHTIRLAFSSTEKNGAHDYVLFAADDTLLFGRLIASDPSRGPIDYVGAFDAHMPEQQPVPIPPRRFAAMLQAANHIAGVVGYSEPYTEITIRREQLRMHVCSRRGEVIDTLRLPGHPDVGVKLHISHVVKAYKAFAPDRILFGQKAVVLARGNHLHLIATGYSGDPGGGRD
jgi:hypothetical protein